VTGPWAATSFPALGTPATLAVTHPATFESALVELRALLAAVDKACSRFRSDSDLIRVNSGAGHPVKVGSMLLDALDVALRAARLTAGDVDPTVGRAVRVLGYDRDFAEVAATGAPLTCLVERIPGWHTIQLDHATSTVQIPTDVELDLGATAKAFAADRAAATIADGLDGGILVSLGGDLAVAGIPPAHGWPVRVTDDHSTGPDAPGETVAIESGGLATSSTTVRRWRRGDEQLHHIIDPAVGRPAPSPWRTVSVVAETCADANIATTAAIVRGETAPGWLDELRLAARLVRRDGDVVRTGGWPSVVRS
jgi:thiamine biosynthesis lipoprotein ApbE